MNVDDKEKKMNNTDHQEEKLMIEAEDFFQKNKYHEVLSSTNKILQKNPEHIEAISLEANALLELGRPGEALDCYDKIDKLDPGYIDFYSWNNLGSSFFEANLFDKAIECYDRAIALNPGFFWGWRNKGLSFQGLERNEEAMQCYDKAIELDPECIDALNDKAVILYLLGRNEESIDYCDRAIKIDPNYVWAWTNKGQALNAIGKYVEAIDCYSKATEIDPNNNFLWNDKGNILLDSGKYNEAISCYNKVIELEPAATYGWRNKALALSRLGKTEEELKPIYEQIVELSKKGLASNPQDTDLLVDLAYTYERLGDTVKSMDYYFEALNIDSKSIGALSGLARIYADVTFEFEKAVEIDRKILQIEPNNLLNNVNYIEDLLKIKNYKEVLEKAPPLLSISGTDIYKCILRLHIFISHLFTESDKQADEAARNFFEYYKGLPDNFIIDKNEWTFSGLIESFNRNLVEAQTKFLLVTIIDLLQGNIHRQSLSFFNLT